MNTSMNASVSTSMSAIAAKQRLAAGFLRKGVIVAILSGMSYGLFTAFMFYVAMAKGVWPGFYEAAGSTVILLCFLSALAAAINDSISAVWCIVIAACKGKAGDFFRSIPTKPGRMMILAALCGGPIASTAYVLALNYAGSLAAPISALCPAIGAILARFFFKQPLTPRMLLGIVICFISAVMIGGLSFEANASPTMLLGVFIALIAAFGWGLEGCVAGYGTSMIDYEIGITIRQFTSGLSNFIILIPLFGLLTDGGLGFTFDSIGKAVTDAEAMPWFIVSAFFAVFAFSLWYKGNSMCGAALGMACNGAFSFWTPLFCWLIPGIFLGTFGAPIPVIGWFAAVLMAFGILVIAKNPFDLFKKQGA